MTIRELRYSRVLYARRVGLTFFLARRVYVRVIVLRELSDVFSDIKSRTRAALSDNYIHYITTYSFLSNQFLSLLKIISRFLQKSIYIYSYICLFTNRRKNVYKNSEHFKLLMVFMSTLPGMRVFGLYISRKNL